MFATDKALDRTVPVNSDNGINESLWKFPGHWRATRTVRNRDVALSGSDGRSLSFFRFGPSIFNRTRGGGVVVVPVEETEPNRLV